MPSATRESPTTRVRVTTTRRVVTTTRTRNTTTTRTRSHSQSNISSSGSPLTTEFLRMFTLVPLTVIFALLVSLIILQHLHNVYLFPLSRKMISNPELTEHELTYYDFVCDESDITAFGPESLILNHHSITTGRAIDRVLHHGMGVFQNLVDAQDASSLRDYVLWRNSMLNNDEKIAVLSWPHRFSFGIGANDHPSVPPVLKSISTNPLLRGTLEGLLGPNPAVVELSTITSEIGADAQGLHSDTNVETSALKFGRSYVNIYTVLIPLQDTHPASGATAVCPGSHRCSYSPACFEHAFQVTTNEHGIWGVGDGLLYSSDALHQGSAHVEGPDRVVLIVSFASRPDHPHWPSIFSRKLPFGAKYAIRWDMLGHTLRDLQYPEQRMTQPWAALRGLGIYKPSQADWGWDSIVMKLAHIVNERPGFRKEWLKTLLQFKVGFLGKIPGFLQGPVQDDPDIPAYQGFILGCLRRSTFFVLSVNVVAVGFYFYATQALTIRDPSYSRSPLYAAAVRLGICYLSVMTVALWVVVSVGRTPWGTDIRSGRIASSPFPNTTYPTTESSKEYIQSLASPNRQDILISDRLLVPEVAAFASVLDHHPGNARWNSYVSDMTRFYFAFFGLPRVFRQGVVDATVDGATLSGQNQFLTQNLLGDWVAMSRDAVRKATEERIVWERFSFMRPPHYVQSGPCNRSTHSVICRLKNPLLDVLLQKILLQRPPLVLDGRTEVLPSTRQSGHFLPSFAQTQELVLGGRKGDGSNNSLTFIEGEKVEGRPGCDTNKWLRATIRNATINSYAVEYELNPGIVEEDVQEDCIRKVRGVEKPGPILSRRKRSDWHRKNLLEG